MEDDEIKYIRENLKSLVRDTICSENLLIALISSNTLGAADEELITQTCKTDSFVLGMIFFFVLTDGKHPFGGSIRCSSNILDGILELKFLGKQTLGESYFHQAIRKMLVQDFANRPFCDEIMKIIDPNSVLQQVGLEFCHGIGSIHNLKAPWKTEGSTNEKDDGFDEGGLQFQASSISPGATENWKKVGDIEYKPDRLISIDETSTTYEGQNSNGSQASVIKTKLAPESPDEFFLMIEKMRTLQSHPNVARILNSIVVQGRYVLFEIESCSFSLKECIEQQVYPLAKPILLRDIACGMNFLHCNGIVHGRLRPSCVLILRSEDATSLIKISDYIYKPFQTADVRMEINSSWVAPETIQGKKTEANGYPADIFVLGCITYFLLTDGIHPFGEAARCEGNILDGEFSLDLLLPATIEHSYKKTLRSMLSNDFSERPAIGQLYKKCSKIANKFTTKELVDKTCTKGSWNDLDVGTRHQINALEINFLGRTKTIEEHLLAFDITTTKEFFQNLSNNAIMELVNDSGTCESHTVQPPPLPTYYIPRTISVRHELFPTIYKHSTNDVLAISGMSSDELIELAGNVSIKKSSDVRDGCTSSFILLDDFSHFVQLKVTKKGQSIHHLSYENGAHIWIQSEGNISLIRDHLKPEKTNMNENDIVKMIRNSHNSKSVLIAGHPGTGKSTLLASLYNTPDTDSGVAKLYLNLSEMANMHSGNPVLCEDPVNTIAKMTTKSPFGQYLIGTLVRAQSCWKLLYVDGLDRVNNKLLPQISDFLKNISQIESTVMYITTRMQNVQKLETELKTLSFEFQPLPKHEQKNLVLGCWNTKIEGDIRQRTEVVAYADRIVSTSISSAIPDPADFLGFPLHCEFLAEIYLIQATNIVPTEDTPAEEEVRGYAVFQLFDKLIELKLDGCKQAVKHSLLAWHTAKSVKVLYPEHYTEFIGERINQYQDYSEDLVNNVGLCVILPCLKEAVFVHVCFAEYFVARWLFQVATQAESETVYKLYRQLCAESLRERYHEKLAVLNTGKEIEELYDFLSQHSSVEDCRRKWELMMQAMNADVETIQRIHTWWIYRRKDHGKKSCDILFIALQRITNFYFKPLPLAKFIHALDECHLHDLSADLVTKYTRKELTLGMMACLMDTGYRVHLNTAIVANQQTNSSISYCWSTLILSNEVFQNMVETCFHWNHSKLFMFIRDTFLWNTKISKSLDWPSVVRVACTYSSIGLVKLVFDYVIDNVELNMEDIRRNLLRVDVFSLLGANRRCFNIFSYVYKKLKPSAENLLNTFYYCLHNTAYLSDVKIENSTRILRLILNDHPSLIEKKTYGIYLPLAVNNIHFRLAEFVIDKDADVNACDLSGNTCVHKAAFYYPAEIFHSFCEIILGFEYGETFSKKNTLGSIPIECAFQCMSVQGRTVRLLASNPQFIPTSFLLAIRWTQPMDVLKELLNAGTKISTRYEPYSQTNVHIAAEHGNLEAIKFFLSHDLDINMVDKQKRTPLHYAFNQRNRKLHLTVQLLVAMKVDVNAVDSEGHSALWYAKNGVGGVTVDEMTIDLLRKKTTI